MSIFNTYFIAHFLVSTIFSSSPVNSDDKLFSWPIETATRQGKIRGERFIPNWSAEYYHVYKGVPYAKPPTGYLRFMNPEPMSTWQNALETTEFPPACAQRKIRHRNTTFGSFTRHRESEDCLYLNVFAPAQRFNETYPVIVWIHGGGFQIGSSADYRQEPILKNFVSRKIVFVSLNYRLGPLGFLSTGDDTVPGNAGLYDIVRALDWIQENIKEFGGDPKSVTLMGQGSGATAAALIALSPKSKEKVHRMILMSGSPFTPGMVRDVVVNATEKLQDHVGCRAYNSSQILECLRAASLPQLLDDSRPRIYQDEYEEFVPIIDTWTGVIPETPYMLARNSKIPAIIGTTHDESSLHLLIFGKGGVNLTQAMNTKTAHGVVANLTTSLEGFTNRELIANGCRFEYIDSRKDPKNTAQKLRDGILELYSDFWYHAPASKFADSYLYDETIYLYSFDHISESRQFYRGEKWPGAFHGSDLIFLFDLDVQFMKSTRGYSRPIDKHITQIFADMLANFARHGNPTPKSSSYVSWTPYEKSKLNYLSIKDSPELRVGFHWRGHVFWNRYARVLNEVDVGNLHYIATLKRELGDYQVATWVLLSSALLFFTILVALACYCMRKDAEDDEL